MRYKVKVKINNIWHHDSPITKFKEVWQNLLYRWTAFYILVKDIINSWRIFWDMNLRIN
jgi:hypothetical protein